MQSTDEQTLTVDDTNQVFKGVNKNVAAEVGPQGDGCLCQICANR